jgi:hypothetical protein
MANKVLPKFKAACISGGANVNLLTGNVKVIMVDEGAYTYSDSHEFLSDIPSGARIATSGNLASKVVTTGGAFQSGNGRCDGVSGASVEAIAMYVDTGADATSRLVSYFNSGVTGLPVTPAGASYNIIPDSTGWFVL